VAATATLLGRQAVVDLDVEGLVPSSPRRRGVLAGQVLQRQHAHADEVGAVDALEALGEDRAHAQQERALGRPVAAEPMP
jgi:hypothetical protein